MQKENSFFFSFPNAWDSRLVSLGSSKNFDECQSSFSACYESGKPSDEKSRAEQNKFIKKNNCSIEKYKAVISLLLQSSRNTCIVFLVAVSFLN